MQYKVGDIRNGLPVLPKEQRKKIIFIADDPRSPSGVGTMSKEIMLGCCHYFNIFSVAAAMRHPELGKIFDLSEATSKETGVPDVDFKLLPVEGYGDPELLRNIIDGENPDAILAFTDPRFFYWLFQMEHEIRQKIPICYLNIWDDAPQPNFNKNFYQSCDLLMGISKQTVNLNKMVLGKGRYEVIDKTVDD